MKTKNIELDGYKIALDRSAQILKIDIPEDVSSMSGRGGIVREPVVPIPTLPVLPYGLVSAAVLLQKAKQFDDGLYAAVEIMCQSGSGHFNGKIEWLRSICHDLARADNANEKEVAATIFGAARLGGIDTSVPQEIANEVESKLSTFEANDAESKPISFYTWTPMLQQIYKQDKLLQTPLPGDGIAKVISTLLSDPKLSNTYIAYVNLITKLTNPNDASSFAEFLMGGGEQPDPQAEYHLFPPSSMPETKLLRTLFAPGKPIPKGFSLIDEIVKRLQSGKLSLAPNSQSGWYDYCLWALEPLVIPDRIPESKKLIVSPLYKQALIDLFKAIYALTRETHTKNSLSEKMGYTAPPKLIVHPDLTIEPLPSVYFRRAVGYRFIKEALIAIFGEEALTQARGMREEGSLKVSLLAELTGMENLFLGAHATACDELGMDTFDYGANVDFDHARTSLLQWIEALPSDRDVGRDARMMVPVFYDLENRKTKCWVFLGWVEKNLIVEFQREPNVVSIDAMHLDNPMPRSTAFAHQEAQQDPTVGFGARRYSAYYPLSAEVYVEKLMNRKEFCAFCDLHASADEIIASLEGKASSRKNRTGQGKKRPWWQIW